jgi:hypothetical protein
MINVGDRRTWEAPMVVQSGVICRNFAADRRLAGLLARAASPAASGNEKSGRAAGGVIAVSAL